MAQNVISQRSWPWKVKVIGQNKWHHQISWPWKHIPRCQNHHPKCLSSKVMVKDVFLYNGGQRNTFAYVSRSNRSWMFFDLLKGPDPSYSVLKFGDNLSSRNRDMAQSVILYSCDLGRSRSSVRSIIFCTAILTLPMSIYVKFRWNRIASCLDTVAYSGQEKKKERKKKEEGIKRNSLMDVHTLWRKLRHEGEIWRKSDQHIIWRSFPEPSLGISWGSIHWAVIKIEPPKLCLKSWELL